MRIIPPKLNTQQIKGGLRSAKEYNENFDKLTEGKYKYQREKKIPVFFSVTHQPHNPSRTHKNRAKRRRIQIVIYRDKNGIKHMYIQTVGISTGLSCGTQLANAFLITFDLHMKQLFREQFLK